MTEKSEQKGQINKEYCIFISRYSVFFKEPYFLVLITLTLIVLLKQIMLPSIKNSLPNNKIDQSMCQ